MSATNGELKEQPIGDLLKQLSEETTTLVRQELQLARAEVTEKGKRAGMGAGFIGGGALFGLGAFGALTAFLIALLATALDHTWLASLIVALVYGAVAGVLSLKGRDKIQEAAPLVPEQTIETIKTTPEAISR